MIGGDGDSAPAFVDIDKEMQRLEAERETLENELANRPSAARKAVSTGSSKESSSGGTTVQNFTQNNYSPKSLDRTTLYRNTKNLFSQLKGG